MDLNERVIILQVIIESVMEELMDSDLLDNSKVETRVQQKIKEINEISKTLEENQNEKQDGFGTEDVSEEPVTKSDKSRKSILNFGNNHGEA